MKFITSELTYFLRNKKSKKDIRILIIFGCILLAVIFLYSYIFHVIMSMEGHEYSWLTGLYWTLTVMSTLGFGDITFTSDLGKAFSILVLCSGVIFLLVMLPFTFIQFFYAPWLEAQTKVKIPRSLDPEIKGHVIITHYDNVTRSLINKLNYFNYPYVIVTEDYQQALQIFDMNLNIVYGDIDSSSTYKRLNVNNAKVVVNSGSDMLNTNISYTVREIDPNVPIVSIAHSGDSVDVLELAGSNYVFQLNEILGRALARRTLCGSLKSNIIGEFEGLKIAEINVSSSPFVDKSLTEIKLRSEFGINAIGIWHDGEISNPDPDRKFNHETVLIITGTEESLTKLDESLKPYYPLSSSVIIIGGGKVGRATAEALRRRKVSIKIIEKNPELIKNKTDYILGSAADINILKSAGIETAQTVIITTNDDDVNIYLSIYCRKLNDGIQIISRANHEKNITTLKRAGAEFIMSYSSLGRNAIFNYIEGKKKFITEEGLNIFKFGVTSDIAGRSLSELEIRKKTGCSIIAVQTNGEMNLNPDPYEPINKNSTLIVVGTYNAEKKFEKMFEVQS